MWSSAERRSVSCGSCLETEGCKASEPMECWTRMERRAIKNQTQRIVIRQKQRLGSFGSRKIKVFSSLCLFALRSNPAPYHNILCCFLFFSLTASVALVGCDLELKDKDNGVPE